MNESSPKSYFETILADVPKGEINLSPSNGHDLVKLPSYGLANCTKKFCVAKVWWDKQPINNDETGYLMSLHWTNHFKGL